MRIRILIFSVTSDFQDVNNIFFLCGSGPGLWLPLGEEADPAAVPGGLSSEEPIRKPTLVSRPCGSWTMICRYIDEGVAGSGMRLFLIKGYKILTQNSKGAS
jgi:hypothetical protein